jgi:hypothetical protein
VAFIEHAGREIVVHRTAWNRLDASDAATGELLTGRDAERAEHFLPYFHGALHPSPDGHWIADDAWASGPTGIPLLWDARSWLADNPWESEDGPSWRPLCQRWYHWDKPMCWVADDLLAVSGIGSGDEAMLDGVRVFDAASGDEVTAFAGPRGLLLSDQRRLYSSGPDGLEAWDPATGERTFRLPGFSPSRRHPGTGDLAQLTPAELRLWRPAPPPPTVGLAHD